MREHSSKDYLVFALIMIFGFAVYACVADLEPSGGSGSAFDGERSRRR